MKFRSCYLCSNVLAQLDSCNSNPLGGPVDKNFLFRQRHVLYVLGSTYTVWVTYLSLFYPGNIQESSYDCCIRNKRSRKTLGYSIQVVSFVDSFRFEWNIRLGQYSPGFCYTLPLE